MIAIGVGLGSKKMVNMALQGAEQADLYNICGDSLGIFLVKELRGFSKVHGVSYYCMSYCLRC